MTASAAPVEPLLSIRDLEAHFQTQVGLVKAVDGVDIDIFPGECAGVVGESGSGKSVTFLSVLGLVRPPGWIAGGSIRFDGRELTALTRRELRRVRGKEIAMTFQDALTSLNPALTVGSQILEVLREHTPADGARPAEAQALEMLSLVGIPEPAIRMRQYPHEFSGGMRQRIMIAIALACRPKLLIADEPTSALDVTIQAQVLDLLMALRHRLGMTVVLITHDLGLVAEYCTRVIVMYAGQVVEQGPTRSVIDDPAHPYTRGLIGSIPRLSRLGEKIRPIEGQVPELVRLADECRFRARCPVAEARCGARIPMSDLGGGREARCVRPGGRR
ncbi:MAG: ABC transporter ATP-binding protein [Proteobacteria bacterium]|nr:ABC transporter ATP-binding protein [Pseudomonadota bacterium]